MNKTQNDIPEDVRRTICEILNDRLADCTDLVHQAKQAHWNVKGSSFIALHKLFDEIVEAAREYMDLFAERVVQLGGMAEGTIRVTAKKSLLPEYPLDISSGIDHVKALSAVLAEFGSHVRKSIDNADKLADKVTADILTEISRGVDQYLWFVEAHRG